MRTKLLTLMLASMVVLLSLSIAGAQERVRVRWFVGLGAGTDGPVITQQEAFVAEFNASQDEILLVLEVIDNAQAYDVLNTQIAAGNAPDIVGPMGIRGRASFEGVWLDLNPLIEATEYDLSDFDPALIDFYFVEGEGQLGLPFAVFPYFIMYNKDIFDEAGAPYPPANYGEPYVDWNGVEREWNTETLRDLALYLTVDIDGNDATMDGFDTDNIVQFGYGTGYTDMRGELTLFGAGNFVDEDNNAQIPDVWLEGAQWIHDAMWVDYFYPNGIYRDSDIMGGGSGNWFDSGNLGMHAIHLWYMGWGTSSLDSRGIPWDLAPIPSHNGEVTAKLHADTFGIMARTRYPEEAFTVLTYMLGENADTLTRIYGGLPARISLQDGFFDRFAEGIGMSDADINWDVALQSLSFPDNPNHEEGMPSFLESSDRYAETWNLVLQNGNLDVARELEVLRAELQSIFNAASR
ncbi:MAG: extracellular solute-binding protein [Anaerolineaceae bacterium]|nr:MAG: extracellular solute-binding protein [Anaerolineaceae bacterium]